MDNVKETLTQDIKNALRAGDRRGCSILRLMLAEIVNSEKSVKNSDPLAVLSSYRKKLTKAVGQFPEGDKRTELEYEIDYVSRYLPAQATEEQIGEYLDQIIKDAPDGQFGPLMKQCMGHFGTGADGKTVSKILKQKLGA